MPLSPSRNTDAVWAAAFARMVAQKERRPLGPEWKTRAELVTMMGRASSYVFRALRAAIKRGEIEKFNGQVKAANGKMGRMVWYRPQVPVAQKGVISKGATILK